MNYGLQYMGSKSKIISQFAYLFPKADNFYDLFGGGFSVSHFMIQRHSKDFKEFHFNEIRSGICEIVQRAIKGEYSYERFKMPWVTREEFFEKKESDAFIKVIWSFGNNGKNYLLGKHIENEKRSLHQCVVFGDFDEFSKKFTGMTKWPDNVSFPNRRLFLMARARHVKRLDLQKLERLQQLERLEQLERLQQLEQLQQLERLTFYSDDYRKIEIKNNSVIYCDIPYKGTAEYDESFNHAEFFDWAHAQTSPVFISEYKIDDTRFKLLKEFKHKSGFSGGTGAAFSERIYGNHAASWNV